MRIVADGPLRSIVQRIIPNWTLSSNLETSFTSTFSIYAGHQWGEHRIRVQGLGDGYRIAIRLPNRGTTPVRNRKDGWVWSWETEAQTNREMGFGIVYPVDGFDRFLDSEAGGTILMRLDQHDEVFYRFASALRGEETEEEETEIVTQETVDGIDRRDESPLDEEEVGIATQEAFEQYVQAMATEIQTPPIIQFTPQEPEK